MSDSKIIRFREDFSKIPDRDYRYWYYYGKNEGFLEWFDSRLDDCGTTWELDMLIVTLRDQHAKEDLAIDVALKCVLMIRVLEKEYSLNRLSQATYMDKLLDY